MGRVEEADDCRGSKSPLPLTVVHVFPPSLSHISPPLSPSSPPTASSAALLFSSLSPFLYCCPVRCGVVSVGESAVFKRAEVVCREMDGKKQPVSSFHPSSSLSSSSSSLVADLFGGKNAPKPSSSSFFHSVFPPASTVMGRDSSHSDVFAPLWKHETQRQNWNTQGVAADGMRQGIGNGERHSAYEHEKIDPCSFSSSLYYGGQDICTNTTTSHNPGYNDKKDGEDGSSSPDAASRGNWWQGSLYY